MVPKNRVLSVNKGGATMRNFILIASFLLVSVTAHAETRGLIVASNDGAAKIEPAPPAAPITQTTQAAPADAAKPVKPPVAAKPRETDEHKARRIAARYGIFW
jgi:hypothetical protein